MRVLGYLVEEGEEVEVLEKHKRLNENRVSNSQQFFKRKTG